MQQYLIILAHGSTDPKWQAPFAAMETRLRERLGDHVRLAYMELCSPLLEEVVEEIAHTASGQQRVDILPLFFAAGRHLRHDVPAQINALTAKFPQLSLELLPPVGQHPAFIDVVAEIVAERDSTTRTP
ncbi:sirohydrochlorin chelatase [Carnimonas nigrificans]|uniref:sirohydrochlorin chelatase n=1 Tax=Carnimonas nigrificans TaxID=64323 RepID=UPI0004726AF4|nr:CbiX/SirB N-terminal domain-containing protein [Carnimonas nigrificans]